MHPSVGGTILFVEQIGPREVRLVLGSTERPAPNAEAQAGSPKTGQAGQTANQTSIASGAATGPGRAQEPLLLEDALFELPPQLTSEAVWSDKLHCDVPVAALAAKVHWTRELWCAALEEVRGLLEKKPEGTFNSRYYEHVARGRTVGDGRVEGGLLRDPARLREFVHRAKRRLVLAARARLQKERAAENRRRDDEARARATPDVAAQRAAADARRAAQDARARVWRDLSDERRTELEQLAREVAGSRVLLAPGESVHEPRVYLRFPEAIGLALDQLLDQEVDRARRRGVAPEKFEPAPRADSSAETRPPVGVASEGPGGAAPATAHTGAATP